MSLQSDTHKDARYLVSGKPAHFEYLVRRYQGPVFGFLARMGIGSADAEELAQEAFLRLWTARDRYDPQRSQVNTWLWSIVRNVALNHLDHVRRRKTHGADAGPDCTTEHVASTDRSTDPDVQAQAQDQLKRLSDAIAQLDSSDQLVIAFAYIDELSTAESAKLCKCSEGAFRVRLSRARRRLLKAFNHHPQVMHEKD